MPLYSECDNAQKRLKALLFYYVQWTLLHGAGPRRQYYYFNTDYFNICRCSTAGSTIVSWCVKVGVEDYAILFELYF